VTTRSKIVVMISFVQGGEICANTMTTVKGYIESAEQSRTAEHFLLAAYYASKSDNKPV